MTKGRSWQAVNLSGYQDVILWIVLLYLERKVPQCLSPLPAGGRGQAKMASL